jgi:(2Fe-2S) ferredoxin
MSDEHCAAQAYEDSPLRVLEKLRFHIFLCTDGKDFCGCEANGGATLSGALRQELARRRLMSQVKINIMQCRQPGIRGPVLVVHPDNVWYSGLKAEHVAEFVEQQILKGEPLTRFLLAGGPQPTTAVPAHVVEAADCCADRQPALTPEQRVAGGR